VSVLLMKDRKGRDVTLDRWIRSARDPQTEF